MIHGLFETHINVSNAEVSAEFYEKVLGLQRLFHDPERRAYFYWVGKPGEAMLGIRENYPSANVQRQHFAFRTEVDELKQAAAWLEQRGIESRNFFGGDSCTLYVFSFMPAVSIYFKDPDGHSLELLAMLPEKPKPELGIITWEEWERLKKGYLKGEIK
ncbi:VOC family protein [Fictibacillus fluitans]|uniref:VOC family protein n=1 Tax=Fictibacillus fluitans TaxID=3058422 RepID=A0ABT8HTF0_9BACL|nr:VOC family protein [Fictibacillus sp. NE201]MDN4524053.1 VOC family protein [Fictibacillus sp. NE201]